MNKLLTGKTILLVEDEMLILMLAEDYLHQLGCTAMVDMNLHGEISDTVADALSDKGVPFLFVTGYVGPSLSERHAHRPVLNKPYAAGQLSALFADLLSENDPPVAP